MSFRRTWTRFGALRRTLGPTPGVREAWHQGRRWYHVWVVDVVEPAVHARRAAVLAALGGAVDPFSAATPHVTVWVSGFVAPPPHPADGARVTLDVGPVNAFASCPFLEVYSPELRAWRVAYARLRGDDGRPPAEDRFGPYLPHLTVARFNGEHGVQPLMARLQTLRRLPPIRCTGTIRLGVVDAWSETGEVLAR